MQVDR